MNRDPYFDALSEELVDAGRFLFERGWLPATSGNLSARIDRATAAITASGLHKGELTKHGIIRVDMTGRAVDPGARPSAETPLHTLLYAWRPRVGAVLHSHSPRATILSRLHDVLRFEGYEIQKAFAGVRTHESVVELPVFENDQDMRRLSGAVERWLDGVGSDSAWGFLIRGHGLYAWGRDVAEARRHVEAFEFLFECEILRHMLQGGPR